MLLVEDDEAISALIALLLEEEGYAVTLATGLAPALAILAREAFDLVITDALADRHAGDSLWTAVEAIRDAAGTVPTVICTASHPRAFADFAARGFRALIQKPFDLDQFLATVASILDPGGADSTAASGGTSGDGAIE